MATQTETVAVPRRLLETLQVAALCNVIDDRQNNPAWADQVMEAYLDLKAILK
jgi:hypothetical protein